MLTALVLLTGVSVSGVSVPVSPPGPGDEPRVERVAELEPSSFLPSWVRGSGMPRLLYVVGEPGGHAALMLGSPLGRDPVELASGSGWFLNWADFPAAGLNGAARVVSWLELTPDAPHSYGTRFQVDEKGRTSAIRPLEDHEGPGEHGFVSFTPYGDGFMALWLDGRAAAPEAGGVTRVYARTVASDGELGPEVVVDPSACSCCPTSLVRLADGALLAAWRDRSEEEIRDIAIARYREGEWSEPEPLARDGWEIDGCPVNGPRLSSGIGGCAASWYTGADGGKVLVSFGDRSGSRFRDPIQVDDGSPTGRGDVALLPDGSALVGWMEHGRQESSWKVRRVTRDGKKGPVALLSLVSAERSSGFLRLALDGESVLAAWTRTEPERRVVVERVTLTD